MVATSIMGLLLGVTLAQYFRVFSLFPFCAAALASSVAVGWMLGSSLEYSVVCAALAVVAIQLGYFLGLATRQMIMASNHQELTKSAHEHAFPSETQH